MAEQDQDFMQAAFGSHGTAATPPPQQGGPAPAAAPSSPSGSIDPDFLKAAFGGPSQGAPSDGAPGAQTSPTPEGDDPARMGEGESALTRPVSTYLGIPEYRQGAGGVERGVEKFASALTSPFNLALMLVTGGLGGLAEAGAATAAETAATAAGEEFAAPALGMAGKAGAAVLSKLAPETAAQVATAAGTVEKLTTLGFSLGQIHDVAKTLPRVGEAIKAGDTDTAMEMITSAALGTVGAGLAAAHAASGSEKWPVWGDDKEAIAESQRPQKQFTLLARNFEEKHSALIKDHPTDVAGMLYHEAGGRSGEVEPVGQIVSKEDQTDLASRFTGEGLRSRFDLKPEQSLSDLEKQGLVRRTEDGLYEVDGADALGKLRGEKPKLDAAAPTDGKPLDTIQQLKKWREEVLADKSIQPLVRDRWADYLDRAQNLPDNVKDLSVELKNEYSKYWQMYKDKQIVREALPGGKSNEGHENYAGPHIYDRADKLGSSLNNRGRDRLSKDPQHLKPREYPTAVDALHAGLEPTRGLAEAHAEYLRQVGQKLSHYEAEAALMRGKTEDTSPMAVSPAAVRRVKEVENEPGDGLGLVTGKTRRGVRLESLGNVDLDKLGDKVFQGQDGHMYFDVGDYSPGPDMFTRRRWTGDKRDPNNSAEGIPITEKEPLLIHPKYVDQVTSAFDDSSWFRKNPIMRSALYASTKAKKSLLSLSPFHWTTEYLRGLQMGLGPLEALNPPKLTPESAALTQKFAPMVLGGGGERVRSEFAEGVATNNGLISKIPGVGKILGNVEEKLFGPNGYVDRLKGAAFEKVRKQIAEGNRNWNTDQADFAAAKIVDSAFGGLNYKMMGITMSSQDALRLMFLAPDFTGSQIAFAKYGVQPGGSVVAQSLGRIALYNFGVAQLLNLLVSGQVHPEHPFGVVSPDEKKVWTVRTMPQDMMHAMTNPREFFYNRLNPVITRTGMETATGRDSEGKVVTQEKQLHDLLRNVLPISMQAALPGYHPEGQTWVTQALRGAGATALPNRSTAAGMAQELASGHTPTGAVRPDQIEHHQLVLDLENKIQSKEIAPDQLGKLVEAGKISQKDIGTIKQSMEETQLMGEADAKLYRYASRLPADEFLKVWDVATSAERKDLRPLLIKRYKSYEKEAIPDDPTWKRLKAIFGNTFNSPQK